MIIFRQSFYQCHIWWEPPRGKAPKQPSGGNKTHSTQHTWIIHITISKLSSFTQVKNKQTNESSWGRMMNNYFLSDFQILKAKMQALELNSVYSGEKVNICLWVKTCIAWIFCYTMTDLHTAFTSAGEQRHARLREFTCAYLRSPAGDSCSASVQTVSRGEGRKSGRWLNWQSCFSSNNNVIQFWAIALA